MPMPLKTECDFCHKVKKWKDIKRVSLPVSTGAKARICKECLDKIKSGGPITGEVHHKGRNYYFTFKPIRRMNDDR